MDVSLSTAYRIIKRLNNELDHKGYITIAGKVSRKYFLERLYGGEERTVSENDDNKRRAA